MLREDSSLICEDEGNGEQKHSEPTLKVRKIEIFFGFDFEICIISLLVMSKYYDFTKKKF
jgi:hypothetical protein